MNAKEQFPVQAMISHAWSGSVIETYNGLQNMVNHSNVPSETRMFYCTFSMYQPQDDADGGLSIAEQLKLEPFAQIIQSRPDRGMFVVHTTISEVYERLWVVHEADVGIKAGLPMSGLFDMYRWSIDIFDIKCCAPVDTRNSKCGSEKDRAYIESLILQDSEEAGGGYERLDEVISMLRLEMKDDLKKLITPKATRGGSLLFNTLNTEKAGDFTFHDYRYGSGDPELAYCVEWSKARGWTEISSRMHKCYGAAYKHVEFLDEYCGPKKYSMIRERVNAKKGKYYDADEVNKERRSYFLPLGYASYLAFGIPDNPEGRHWYIN